MNLHKMQDLKKLFLDTTDTLTNHYLDYLEKIYNQFNEDPRAPFVYDCLKQALAHLQFKFVEVGAMLDFIEDIKSGENKVTIKY